MCLFWHVIEKNPTAETEPSTTGLVNHAHNHSANLGGGGGRIWTTDCWNIKCILYGICTFWVRQSWVDSGKDDILTWWKGCMRPKSLTTTVAAYVLITAHQCLTLYFVLLEYHTSQLWPTLIPLYEKLSDNLTNLESTAQSSYQNLGINYLKNNSKDKPSCNIYV